MRELSHGWKHAIAGHLGHVGIIMPDDNILAYMIPEFYQQKVYEVLGNKELVESNTLDSFKQSNKYLGFSHTSLTEKERKHLVDEAVHLRDDANNGKYEYTLLPRFYLPHMEKVWYYKKSTQLEHCSWFNFSCYGRNAYRRKYNKPIYGAYYKKKFTKGLMRCDTYVAMIYYRGVQKSLAGFGRSYFWSFWSWSHNWYKYGGYFFPKDIWSSLTTHPANSHVSKTVDCVELIKEPVYGCAEQTINGIVYGNYPHEEVLNSYSQVVEKMNNDSQNQQICLEHGYNKIYYYFDF